ncbi:hypothetical protein TNCV_3654681 [Trichonephila clavipes]|nr:hypothetical protein TNCV_3654681 [Trichonephila clavipes]
MLCVSARHLSYKNPHMLSLGKLEKCGNIEPRGDCDETGRNPCCQKKKKTNADNSDLTPGSMLPPASETLNTT